MLLIYNILRSRYNLRTHYSFDTGVNYEDVFTHQDFSINRSSITYSVN